jgi:hypothetical protein
MSAVISLWNIDMENVAAGLHEMSDARFETCIANGADLSLSGYERRLLAVRTAIRHRHPQTGERLWCHMREYRAVYAADARKLRRIIKRLRALT